MNIQNHKLIQIIIGILLTVPLMAPVVAEDIEIYVGNTGLTPEVKPNLMFVIDTSGSMDASVVVRDDYDININYSGCFNNSKVYFSTGKLPDYCGTSRYFNKEALKCDAAMIPLYNNVPPATDSDPALASGWYQDRIAQWKDVSGTSNDEWTNIFNSQKNRYIECKYDSGKHGLSDTGNKYIANFDQGPYTALETDSLDWNGIGRGYVLYTGNYLNWTQSDANNTSTRLEVVKKVTYDVVDSTNNINIGLMRFDSASPYDGGPIRYPVLDVTIARNDFKSRLKTMTPKGGTPLSEVLYENYLYWAAKAVDYGATSTPKNSTGVTQPGNPKYYKSPIEYTCQKNFNIYLSDGEASFDGDADSKISALPGFADKTGGCSGNCLDELAQYMYTYDVYDDLAEEQNVATYTVGFAIDHQLLKDTAKKGGAKYYTADDATELAEVFNLIIAEILSVNTTFSSPAVSVNAFNRTTHRNDLYFTLFKPAVGPHWDGNMKRFKLVFDDDGVPSIVDANGDPAINKITGFFDEKAYSYWTDLGGEPDGGEVTLGGAAAQIDSRKVYTYTGSTVPNNEDLSSSANAFVETNAALTKELMNIAGATDDYRTTLIKWARGIDVDDDDSDNDITDPRQFMGDPLHSEPALIQYDGPDSNPDITAYVATNDGVLHAIDTRDGTEIFSFIPQELLPLQKVVYENVAGDGKAYGIDGSVNSLVIDVDKNGVIETGDKVYVFFGQRRGGRNYYAMDVTDRSSPKLMWVIKGGAGSFVELGQSWSNIQIKKILLGGVKRYVAVFAGGYDVDQDSNSVRTADDVGRALYIVDALTGKRLWWAGPKGSGADVELDAMQYSIPARLKAVDVAADGYLDRMYVGDMGGQVWRVDIAPSKDSADLAALIAVNRVAALADGTIEGNRRFYYPPDVAIISEPGKDSYLALAVNSGYRAHPLNLKIHDRIYMLKDPYVFTMPSGDLYGSDTTGIVEADLYNATDNTIGQGSETDSDLAIADLSTKSGWYVELNETDGSYIGEKGLSEALIIGGLIITSTYIPSDGTAEACKPADGTGYVYFMSVTDATPQYNFDTIVDASDDLTREDRRNKLTRGGIPPNPAPIYTKDGSAVIIGTEPVDNPEDDTAKKLFWYEDILRP